MRLSSVVLGMQRRELRQVQVFLEIVTMLVDSVLRVYANGKRAR